MFKKENRNLLIIALIAIVNALGYGIVIPILYSYSKHFGLSDFQNGLLFSVFSLCAFVATPLIGRMSDKYGRKPLLVISILGTTISFFMQAFAPSAMWLFIARALDGLTAGNISVASAVISDTTKPEDRAKGFGIIGASFGFGFIFGPAISAATVGISPSLPFLIAGIISAIAVIMTAAFLPETNKHIGQVEHKKLFDFVKLIHALVDPSVGITLLISLVYAITFSMYIFAFQPYAVKAEHLSANAISVIFTGIGVIGLLVQVLFVGRLTKMLGPKKIFTLCFLVAAIIFFIMFGITNFYIFLIASLSFALVNSFVMPITQTLLSEETDDKSQGTIQGLNSSYMSIGQIVGPIIGGIFASMNIGLPFLGSGAVAIICFFLSFQVLRKGVKKEAAF